MAIILDVLVVAIMVLSVFLAYKKGLIRTLFSLVGGIAAVMLAFSFLAPVSGWIEGAFVAPVVRNTVLTAVNGVAPAEDYEAALDSIDVVGKLKEMPEELRTFLESMNADVDGLIAKAEQSKADSAAAKEALIDSIVDPISGAISNAIAMIGLVLIFFLLLLVASRLLDAIFKLLPLGKSVNKVGGILFGAIRALLLVMLFGTVVYWLAYGGAFITMDQLEDTLLLRIINEYNPILNALK